MKYTKELLAELTPLSTSFADLARKLGIAPVGSNTTNLKSRCIQHGIDVSHFTGSVHNKGKPARNRLPVDEFLVLGDKLNRRTSPKTLRRCLIEKGVQCKCSVCGLDEVWNGKPLQLQIDHIDGCYWNNVLENLRFICPNCHVQTETWGRQKTSCPGGGMADTVA